ncbi:ribosome-associated translation inhibitor RaiA [Granulicatella sp. zg-ZJ]|uniref:ribosome hibernation-promoting factor, HPF/YfiA family n=1 Tax=unclassified Granulicatella TaxID=2630493 RepID=UPI0013BF8DCE|nr:MULTISPECIES: ribosome-associated translation inhibitor RaiA [unclassified Granulicatella]MBS4750263.1 ribosome-associated translation inhibitor RaiA [Carnobacteriaceae bacterium zg-ZUI78]NEW62505.1 ribosome-associated translation inhibitor RaiA [Granulicatella sp. zg-ZJ]NEW66552.1 ribosome-associated translation inhibitor RaiA [Granulicatella sp. zg-84]QMI85799.1 ribosome-associated translation inhibitor RaiA [Carnobacteriaceae bacterium zg-84]
MLTFNIRGENIEVTEALRLYNEKKIGKLEKYFSHVPNVVAHVNLKVYPDKNAKVEVTIPLPYIVLRAEETTSDLYGSIDLVIEKLERQIRKYKTKIQKKSREHGYSFEPTTSPVETTKDEETDELEIARIKRIPFRPMDSQEALLQMNLLGHDFFAYIDIETEELCVVYRRKDGKYGLIEAER